MERDSLSTSQQTENVLNSGQSAEAEEEENEQLDSGSKLNPLELDNIMEKILGYLDLASLKAARQMNKLWNSEGIKLIFNKSFISLPQDIHSSENHTELLERFQTFLSHKSYKIPHLSVQDKAHFEILKSLKVLKKEAGEVQSLKWSVKEEETESIEFFGELLNKLPNLNYLKISENPDPDFPDIPLGLKKVLLNFCITKKSQPVQMDQKPFVISNFDLSIPDRRDFNFIQDVQTFFLCQGVRILKLGVDGPFYHRVRPEVISMTNTLLLRQQENLIGLTLKNCTKYLRRLDFPLLPKLKELSLIFDTDIYHLTRNSFPPSLKLAGVAPYLKKFTFTCYRIESESTLKQVAVETQPLPNIFERIEPAPSVQELVYCENDSGSKFTSLLFNPLASHTVEKLFETFPNVQNYTGYMRNFEPAAKSLWKIGINIKNLTLEFPVRENWQANSRLDSIFTGFSQETVNKIRDLKDRADSNFENLRVNPSILDLKNLETLTIKFRESLSITFVHYGFRDKCLLSRILSVTRDYAFKLMPNVNIKICTRGLSPATRQVAAPALEKLAELPNVVVGSF